MTSPLLVASSVGLLSRVMASVRRKSHLSALLTSDDQPTNPSTSGDFVEGSILRITMKNFLTYDHSVVIPGPNLNMIVGANGTGKSSIVCAICLGLAGKTAILGRGDKVGLYVKRGCNKGSVEIELYKNGGNLVITREIHVDNNQSVWMMNGRHSGQRAVEEEVKALRIQVSNLCQFLPQEKVGEFAKMTKIELLEATEKSVGSPKMYEYHCELRTFRTKERDLENVVKDKVSFLKKAKQRNERNKNDVERYYEKKRHLDNIQMLENKKAWVAFSQLPTSLDEIDARLNEERARAECFTGLSENVVDEYNRRVQEIKSLEKELEDRRNALDTYRQNISEAKELWLNPLKQLVEQINEKFSAFFRSMQCAGEVDLHSESEEEYDKYGIRIRVKFRNNTELHELTAHYQSGGERSVSTMLYLMALQELNRCPFRVLDEINQGMDPVNERRVFDIVVRTACKETTSQYFFITPKLLVNLQYAEEMTILCIHNGAHMLPANKWEEKSFIRRSSRRKEATTAAKGQS